jgi:RAB protein geranylgeranyltransferase component A
MECLSETKWDVVISGTGLVQSLLALSVLFPALNPDSLF